MSFKIKIRQVFLMACMLVLSGCTGQKKITSRKAFFASPQTSVVKAMTFNIRVGSAWWDGPNRWNNRKQIVFDTIIDNAADVIGLQEALDYQVHQIQQALGQYDNYAIGRNDGKQKGETCAIFYRKDRFKLVDNGTFWFSKTPQKPGSKHWGNIFPRICSWVQLMDMDSKKVFYVYNVHLDHISQRSRINSVRLLAEVIAKRKTNDPFIVMGDFNMELDNPAMMYLQKIGYETPYPRMVDAWSAVHPNAPHAGTAHNFWGRTKGPKIDHIPVSEKVQALEVNIDRYAFNGQYPSDHFPVVAILKFL